MMDTTHLTATVTYSRKVGKPNYSSEDAGIFIQVDFPLGTEPVAMEQQLQAAFAQAKTTVLEELGIAYNLNEDGSVEEVGATSHSKSGPTERSAQSVPASDPAPAAAAPAEAAPAAAPAQQYTEGQKRPSSWLKDGNYGEAYQLLLRDKAMAQAAGVEYAEWWGGKDSIFYCNQAMRALQRKGLTGYPTDYHNDRLAGTTFKGKLDDFRVKPSVESPLAGMRGLFFLMEKHTEFNSDETPPARDRKYLAETSAPAQF